MRRIMALSLISWLTVVVSACSAPIPRAVSPLSAESCSQPESVKSGATSTCSAGCIWSGAQCERQRGIIVEQAAPDQPKPPPAAQPPAEQLSPQLYAEVVEEPFYTQWLRAFFGTPLY
jgi:hypothetical protein